MKSLSLIVAMLLAGAGVVPAYVLNYNGYATPQKWDFLGTSAPSTSLNPATDSIRFYLASDAYSATNTAAELNAIRATFGQWQSIPNTLIKFEDGGLVAPRSNININDGTNVVFFAKTSTVNGEDITGVLGRTYVSYTVPGNILLQGDIILNAYNRTWFTDFTDTSATNVFIEAVLAHEIGHLLGLSHSPVGAASMLTRGSSIGLANLQAWLAADDIACAQSLYAVTRTNFGAIKGTVTKSGSAVLGAQVFVENSVSNLVAGTVTRSTGAYEINTLPPGTYRVRVTPLDPNTSTRLVSGSDITSEFSAGDSAFVPSTNFAVSVAAGITNTLNIALTNRAPAFRITHIRTPTTHLGNFPTSVPAIPIRLKAGQSGYYVGVAGPALPTGGATFSITGDGLTSGAPIYNSDTIAGVSVKTITALVSVSSNATPGARSFIVTQYGTNVAYANGFLEIQPTAPDYNFDGLDDYFQRAYFPLFTATQAGPNANPDGDAHNNYAEYLAGTDPTNAASILRIQSVGRTNNTATVRWNSADGKRYQLAYTTNAASAGWANVGGIVTANGASASANDSAATNAARFYRVAPVP